MKQILNNRNIVIRISNEKEFNYVKNYCQQNYCQQTFELTYESDIRWIYINNSDANHFFKHFFEKDAELNQCPSLRYYKQNYFVIDNFCNFLREDKLKRILTNE